MHILEVGRLLSIVTWGEWGIVWYGWSWNYESRQIEEVSLQVANMHSNSHMHLNTVLPFVYAVSMVRVILLQKLMNFLLRLGMLMVLCSW